MKKLLAILLTLCMMTALLTSCGPSFDHTEEQISFYEELAAAIADGDDAALEEIVEEIKLYGDEFTDLVERMEEVEEDYEDDLNDLTDKISDLREDERVSSSCLSALENSVDYAEYYAAYLDDPEDAKAIYDEILETVKEGIEAAREKDSAGVREIAIDLRDAYYDKYQDCRKKDMKYDDELGEIYDEYGDDIMSAVSSVYRSALYYNDKDYLLDYYGYSGDDVSEIRKNLPCSLDIHDLKDRYDF